MDSKSHGPCDPPEVRVRGAPERLPPTNHDEVNGTVKTLHSVISCIDKYYILYNHQEIFEHPVNITG